MILANLLLALAWVGLNGRFTLDSLIIGRAYRAIRAAGPRQGWRLIAREVRRVERAVSLLVYLAVADRSRQLSAGERCCEY